MANQACSPTVEGALNRQRSAFVAAQIIRQSGAVKHRDARWLATPTDEHREACDPITRSGHLTHEHRDSQTLACGLAGKELLGAVRHMPTLASVLRLKMRQETGP
jgi:hypothetical protein